MLPPEAQSLLGGIAFLVAIVGLIVWAAGVKIARFSVAILLGAAGGTACAWLLPLVFGIAAVTGGLVGFVAGALAGAVGFRILQGVTLAVCLGIAAGARIIDGMCCRRWVIRRRRRRRRRFRAN